MLTYTRSTWMVMMMIVMEEDMMIKIEMMITIIKMVRIERFHLSHHSAFNLRRLLWVPNTEL